MEWQTFLTAQGAEFDDTQAATFADYAAQVDALEHGVVITPLTHFALIRLHGEETVPFLHGQLSSDVKKLAVPGCQYSSYSTPKGRMLTSFLLLRTPDEVLLQLPAALLPSVQKRLSMFILRSKTRAEDASGQFALLGVAGPKGTAALAALGYAAPSEPGQVIPVDGGWLARLPGDRFQLCLAADTIPAVWTRLTQAGAVPASAACWTLSDIRAGIPWVLPATQEAFVPQMANMELIGAVNFQKGCYPGQEIVARTQYLGRLKRRALRMRSDIALQAGDTVYSPEMNGQASGTVALAAPVTATAWEALVVVQLSSVEHGLHLQSPEGPLLAPLPLPYSVAEPE